MKVERYKKEQKYFTEKLNLLGGEALVLSAEYDESVQMQQAAELINKGIKVLVLNAVNQNTAGAIVRFAHKHKVKVIAYDRLISNCDLDYYLSFNSEKGGQLMAEYALKLKPEGNYLVIGGDKSDRNAIFVNKGQMQALDPYLKTGKVKLLYHIFIEKWSDKYAQFEITQFLRLSKDTPDVILAASGGISTGVINALREFNFNRKIIITGQDASLENCRNIVSGKQTMTIYKKSIELAYKAAELAIMLAKGDEIEKINLFGIKPSHKALLREELNKQVALSLDKRPV